MAFSSTNSETNSETSDTPAPAPSQHALGIPRPPSVGGISSRVTEDMASEDGDHSQSYTAVSSHVPPRSRPSVSKTGPPPVRNSVMSHTTNRPGSSNSRLSRSHIPSLAAQGFFRPLSSQRLQAHRGRPVTKSTESSEDWGDHASQNRRSLVSNSTLAQSSIPQEQEAPPSRGTEFTDPIIPDRNTSNASPIGTTTVRSIGESAKLLREKERSNQTPQPHPNLGVSSTGPSSQDISQRSPLSFLSPPNRNGDQEHRDSRNHERLSSAGSSPESIQKQDRTVSKSRLGKNYEYFLGNTIFCGGGRFQNSRDKPVNIATGILVVVPSALFFAFS
ncbi:hypothetical protein BDV29DRAFT_153978 [Aspergillus leporis]|jgi:palmitoyltransferase ZDHHC9/14/18|uniref:Uncharacterized protein n=1 Tax=Aspergillus leporis TaxID=41062 RepID=A0A5N5X8N6_9EURO|nr:hypothetical protein BDV29DRAFT_153978 [Aspergillus leporis]